MISTETVLRINFSSVVNADLCDHFLYVESIDSFDNRFYDLYDLNSDTQINKSSLNELLSKISINEQKHKFTVYTYCGPEKSGKTYIYAVGDTPLSEESDEDVGYKYEYISHYHNGMKYTSDYHPSILSNDKPNKEIPSLFYKYTIEKYCEIKPNYTLLKITKYYGPQRKEFSDHSAKLLYNHKVEFGPFKFQDVSKIHVNNKFLVAMKDCNLAITELSPNSYKNYVAYLNDSSKKSCYRKPRIQLYNFLRFQGEISRQAEKIAKAMANSCIKTE